MTYFHDLTEHDAGCDLEGKRRLLIERFTVYQCGESADNWTAETPFSVEASLDGHYGYGNFTDKKLNTIRKNIAEMVEVERESRALWASIGVNYCQHLDWPNAPQFSAPDDLGKVMQSLRLDGAKEFTPAQKGLICAMLYGLPSRYMFLAMPLIETGYGNQCTIEKQQALEYLPFGNAVFNHCRMIISADSWDHFAYVWNGNCTLQEGARLAFIMRRNEKSIGANWKLGGNPYPAS